VSTHKRPLDLVDDVFTIEGIGDIIRQKRPDLVVVDFIQNVDTAQKFNNRRDKIDHVSRTLKRLAQRYKCHVMVLAQLARGDGVPTMASLKEAGGLEQDGDYIMLLHRPGVADKTKPQEEALVLLDKNKYGRTGLYDLYFDGAHQRFTETYRIAVACYLPFVLR
jgi:replicative DNA helicase